MNPSHRPKILFLTSSYPRGPEDTASVFLRYLAEHIANCGADVHVLAPADGTSETAIEGKVTVHRFRYLPASWQGLAYGSGMLPNLKRSPWLWLQVPFFLIAMTYSLVRLLASQRFDLVHAHWILPQGLVGLGATFFFRVPLIVTAHGADAFALHSIALNLLKKWVISHAAAWTVNTTATSDALSAFNCLPKPSVIPMGVDINLFSAGNPTLLRSNRSDGELLLLFVGRLVEKKGCKTLIHAFSLLPPTLRERTTLWIIGDGDQKSKLVDMAQRLEIEHKIKFWGTLSNHRLPDFYAAADIFVMPSMQDASGDTEGLGVVLLEAFAGRTCVLASRIGGIEHVIKDNVTGLLVPPGDPTALVTKIEQLLNQPALRGQLAANAFAEVCNRYSWTQIAAEFRTLYSEILAPASQ